MCSDGGHWRSWATRRRRGIFDELRLLAWDYEFPPGPPPAGLTYVQRPARLDARLAQNIKKQIRAAHGDRERGRQLRPVLRGAAGAINCRAYLGSFLRRPAPDDAALPGPERVGNRGAPRCYGAIPGLLEGRPHSSAPDARGIHAGRAAERLERGVAGVRAFLEALNGTRAVWRASALNLGTDVDAGDRDRVNALLLEINKQVKAFAPEVLDVEAFSAARPETLHLLRPVAPLALRLPGPRRGARDPAVLRPRLRLPEKTVALRQRRAVALPGPDGPPGPCGGEAFDSISPL